MSSCTGVRALAVSLQRPSRPSRPTRPEHPQRIRASTVATPRDGFQPVWLAELGAQRACTPGPHHRPGRRRLPPPGPRAGPPRGPPGRGGGDRPGRGRAEPGGGGADLRGLRPAAGTGPPAHRPDRTRASRRADRRPWWWRHATVATSRPVPRTRCAQGLSRPADRGGQRCRSTATAELRRRAPRRRLPPRGGAGRGARPQPGTRLARPRWSRSPTTTSWSTATGVPRAGRAVRRTRRSAA